MYQLGSKVSFNDMLVLGPDSRDRICACYQPHRETAIWSASANAHMHYTVY